MVKVFTAKIAKSGNSKYVLIPSYIYKYENWGDEGELVEVTVRPISSKDKEGTKESSVESLKKATSQPTEQSGVLYSLASLDSQSDSESRIPFSPFAKFTGSETEVF